MGLCHYGVLSLLEDVKHLADGLSLSPLRCIYVTQFSRSDKGRNPWGVVADSFAKVQTGAMLEPAGLGQGEVRPYGERARSRSVLRIAGVAGQVGSEPCA